jgi:hypothetical protein
MVAPLVATLQAAKPTTRKARAHLSQRIVLSSIPALWRRYNHTSRRPLRPSRTNHPSTILHSTLLPKIRSKELGATREIKVAMDCQRTSLSRIFS